MKILVSRIDSIGDVILTLPLCGWIKKNISNSEVHFLCQKMTQSIVSQSEFIDHVHVWDGGLPEVDVIIHVFPNKNVAQRALQDGIKLRVGTSHRLFHLYSCNKLVNFSRIKSDLHEAQLNFKLLKGIGKTIVPSFEDLSELTGWKPKRSENCYIDRVKFNLILHIKSRGSAKEWEAKNYLEIAKQLPMERCNIILTGTAAEKALVNKEVPEIFDLPNVVDTTGKLSLNELICLIASADGLLACSTGPLHIAGISGINTLGLYPKQRPMHAGRWGPLGEKSRFLEEENTSPDKYLAIPYQRVEKIILDWL